MIYFALQVIIVAATVAACYIFIATLARKYLGYNPTAPSAWERFKAWWPGFVKRHIVDDDPNEDELHAVARYYDKPLSESIECARAAVKAGSNWCVGQLSPFPCRFCPVKEYCDNAPRTVRYHVAMAWLHAHGLPLES